MPEILETFSTYVARIERCAAQMDKPIVLSTDVTIATLRDSDEGDITKVPIAWPLYQHNMFYIVTVPPKKHIPRHSHKENLFRLILTGELTLNGSIEIREGMWFVIRAGTPYEVRTETGYTSLAAYVSVCQTSRGAEGKHLIDE